MKDINKDGDERVRKSAAKALGMIEAKAAVSPLITALDDPSDIVRKSVVSSLGQIGDTRAVQYLEKMLKDRSYLVQRESGDALKKLAKKS